MTASFQNVSGFSSCIHLQWDIMGLKIVQFCFLRAPFHLIRKLTSNWIGWCVTSQYCATLFRIWESFPCKFLFYHSPCLTFFWSKFKHPQGFLLLIIRFLSYVYIYSSHLYFFIQCSMDLKLRRCLPYFNLSLLEQSQDNLTSASDESFLLSILMQKEDSRGNIGWYNSVVTKWRTLRLQK